MQLPSPGDQFQRKYKLHEVLGKGGFAAVYRATDVEIGRDVAIKVLSPSGDGYSSGIESRFMREGRVIAGLQDPHTITMFEFGRSDDGLLYMVFEYVRGTDLSVIIRRGALPEPVVIHLMRQVLQSLREAHASGVLHRDIKPANILVYEYMDDPYRAKLLDFGIAKPTAGDGVDITSDGAMIGTPRYMSPEQIYGATLTASSDLFSLGLVGYEMLVGRPAISGKTAKEMIVQQLSDTPVQLPPDVNVSPPMRNVINRMLARDPKDRFPAAEQAIQALDFVKNATGATAPGAFATGRFGTGPFGAAPARFPTSPPGAFPAVPPQGPQPSGTMPGYPPTPQQTPRPGMATHTGSGWDRPGVMDRTPSASYERAPATQPEQPTHPPTRGRSTLMLAGGGLAVGAAVVGLIAFASYLSRQKPEPVERPSVVVATPGRLIATKTAPDAAPPEPTPPPSAPDAGSAADVGSHARGCGRKPDWSGVRRFTRDVGLGARSWLAYLPQSYDPDREYPVMLMFHKGFNDARWIIRDTRIEPLADEEGFIVVAVEAEDKTSPWPNADIPLIEGILDEMDKEACIDRRRVFGVGHGAGGDFVLKLACETSLTGVSTVGAGDLRGWRNCAKPVPFIRMAGLDDRYIPVGGGASCLGGDYKSLDETEEDWRVQNVCEPTRQQWDKRPNGVCYTWSCKAPFVSCHLEGGHDWPHSAKEKFEMPGCPYPPPKFPMIETIWRFFDGLEPLPATEQPEQP